MQRLERIVVTLRKAIFAGQESLGVSLDAGVRAVQSTPLLSSGGTILGMISTHYCEPHRPSEREPRFMELSRGRRRLRRSANVEREQVHAENTRKLLVGELNRRVIPSR